MILCDNSIAYEVDQGDIGVEPPITDEQIQPASLDLRIGPKLYDMDKDEHHDDGDLALRPETHYIGHTLDKISLPDRIGALLTGRSSIGRRGVVVHQTAGWIDPGFTGQITLELYNFSETVEYFDIGDRVAQLIFFPTDRPSSGYDGQYQDQMGITDA